MLALRYLARPPHTDTITDGKYIEPMRKITQYAREHRQKPTPAEAKMKRLLLTWKITFRSQRQFDYFIVDFLIPHKRLVIEVDGGYHRTTQDYDERRQRYLERLGLNVIRISNEEVLGTDCSELRRRIEGYPDYNIRDMDFRIVYGTAKY